jgi:hypothetical protein
MIHVLLMAIGMLGATPVERVTTVVDLRGVSVREAFDKLSEALKERIIIAREVPAEIMERDIRLHTEHLSPEQSVRWVARLVGLQAVRTKEGYYVATAVHLAKLGTPLQGTERVLLSGASASAPEDSSVGTSTDQRIRELANRHGPIFWQDTPLSRVSADVSRVFNVDLIFHPDVLGSESLLDWEQPDTSLQGTCDLLAHELKAAIEFRDGALWVRPVGLREIAEMPASAPTPADAQPTVLAELQPGPKVSTPSGSQTQPAHDVGSSVPHENRPVTQQRTTVAELSPRPTTQPTHARSESPRVIYSADGSGSPKGAMHPIRSSVRDEPPSRTQESVRSLPGHLSVDSSIRDWSALARHVEMATGGPCRVRESGRRYEPMEIDGSTSQVLEALKLMGKLDYRLETSPAGGVPTVELLISPRR